MQWPFVSRRKYELLEFAGESTAALLRTEQDRLEVRHRLNDRQGDELRRLSLASLDLLKRLKWNANQLLEMEKSIQLGD